MTFKPALAVAALLASGMAHSATYDYAAWTATPTGAAATITTSAGPVGVTYSGPGIYQGDTPNWAAEPSTWSAGVVSNLPTNANGLIHLTGGDASVNTLTFSQAVTNPVIAIWSLGQGGAAAEFDFGATPTFIAGGPSFEYGGPALLVNGNVVSGNEANGTVEFQGTFTSITWTNPKFENWYGMTVGVTAVPEPGTLGLMLAGLTLVGLARRRQVK